MRSQPRSFYKTKTTASKMKFNWESEEGRKEFRFRQISCSGLNRLGDELGPSFIQLNRFTPNLARDQSVVLSREMSQCRERVNKTFAIEFESGADTLIAENFSCLQSLSTCTPPTEPSHSLKIKREGSNPSTAVSHLVGSLLLPAYSSAVQERGQQAPSESTLRCPG